MRKSQGQRLQQRFFPAPGPVISVKFKTMAAGMSKAEYFPNLPQLLIARYH